MYELVINESTYNIEEGSIIYLKDNSKMFGDWIKICTDEFDVECTKLEYKNGFSIFKVDKIIDKPDVVDEIVPDFNHMLKSELIEYANNKNLNVTSKMTKAQIIEMITSNL